MFEMFDDQDKLALLILMTNAPPAPTLWITQGMPHKHTPPLEQYTDRVGPPPEAAEALLEIYKNWRDDPIYDLGEEPSEEDLSEAAANGIKYYSPDCRQWLRDMAAATKDWWEAKAVIDRKFAIDMELHQVARQAAWARQYASAMFDEWKNQCNAVAQQE